MENSVQVLYEKTAIGDTVDLRPVRQSSAALRQFQNDVAHVRSLEQNGFVETSGAHVSSEEGIGWLDKISFKRLR